VWVLPWSSLSVRSLDGVGVVGVPTTDVGWLRVVVYDGCEADLNNQRFSTEKPRNVTVVVVDGVGFWEIFPTLPQ
jgi:hypothetical protein